MIDHAVKDIPDDDKGFTLVLFATPFPGCQISLQWRRADGGGNRYYSSELDMEGWLCPALLRQFAEPPQAIYAQVGKRTS